MAVKTYTVTDFCKKYNSMKANESKVALVQSVMNTGYVPFEMKVTICEKIVEATYYKKETMNGIEVKKLHINSPSQYMSYYLWMVKEYTHINIDFKNSLEEFNLLNKSGLLDVIVGYIPEGELKEFRMLLDMVASDAMANEYETHAFISNQIERFGQLFGAITKPALEQLSKAIENVDEKTIEKMFNKLNGLNKVNGIKEKLNIIK